MQSAEIRQKFLKFFEEKGHKVVPSSSLVPEGDSSVLFTTAGMQQFKPYYLGQPSPYGPNTVSVQKCVRTSDIEEVGDESHLTFFEMLGNFSFGGYWKKEAIQYAHKFVTKVMGLKIDYVTVFEGESGVPEDTESAEIWKSIDLTLEIKKFGRADNFWGPTGEEGPCGPTTEIYVKGIEIWNIVFNEFYQSKDKTLKPLDIKGIDTGMGLERLAMVSQNVPTVFDTDLFKDLLNLIDNQKKKVHGDFYKNLVGNKKRIRIIADHLRTVLFLVSAGILPGKNEREYVVRKLMRRTMLDRGIEGIYEEVFKMFESKYRNSYQEIDAERASSIYLEEYQAYNSRLEEGGKEFNDLYVRGRHGSIPFETIDGKKAFHFYSTHGVPLESFLDMFETHGLLREPHPTYQISSDIREEFEIEMQKHQEVSKAGSEQKFKGGLAGHSEMEVKYHTATHLLHQALHDVLGDEVEQRGSNITPERLRFDFSFPRKLTEEEKKKVEDVVNGKISESLPMNKTVMPKAEAEKNRCLSFFR
jgi:alanyl-tRNA synthetase